jgi:hypothetical protein
MMRLQRVGQEGTEDLFMQGVLLSGIQLHKLSSCNSSCSHIIRLSALSAGELYPSSGKATKTEGRRMAQRFGPIRSWKTTYDASEPELIVSTDLADYRIMSCAPEFREHYNDVREQIAVCHCIVQGIKKEAKNTQDISFESVLAAVNRAKVAKGYVSTRDAVLLSGSFILAQLPAMQAVLDSSIDLVKSGFVAELKCQV